MPVEQETVIPFPGASIAPVGQSDEIVEMLDRAIGEARSGHLIGLALVKVYRQPISFGQSYHTESDSAHSLVAGIVSLLHRVGAVLNTEENN